MGFVDKSLTICDLPSILKSNCEIYDFVLNGRFEIVCVRSNLGVKFVGNSLGGRWICPDDLSGISL